MSYSELASDGEGGHSMSLVMVRKDGSNEIDEWPEAEMWTARASKRLTSKSSQADVATEQ